MRECCHQLQEARGRWPFHLGAVSPFECTPRAIISRPTRDLHEILGRRELGQPQVVEIARRMLALGHAAWGPPHGPETETFTGSPGTAEPDDVDSHRSSQTDRDEFPSDASGNSSRARRADNRQVRAPRSNGLGILSRHRPHNLRQMTEIVRHPGCQVLFERDDAELRM